MERIEDKYTTLNTTSKALLLYATVFLFTPGHYNIEFPKIEISAEPINNFVGELEREIINFSMNK